MITDLLCLSGADLHDEGGAEIPRRDGAGVSDIFRGLVPGVWLGRCVVGVASVAVGILRRLLEYRAPGSLVAAGIGRLWLEVRRSSTTRAVLLAAGKCDLVRWLERLTAAPLCLGILVLDLLEALVVARSLGSS